MKSENSKEFLSKLDQCYDDVFVKVGGVTIKNSAFDHQVGGNHYKDMVIQPLEYAIKNKLGPGELLVLKYISRKKESRIEDLQKAIHVLQMMIELEWQ